MGLYGEVRHGFDRFIGLNSIGDHLESAAGRSAAKDDAFFGERIGGKGECQSDDTKGDEGYSKSTIHEISSFTD